MRRYYWTICILFIFHYSYAQGQVKVPLDHSVYSTWNVLGQTNISNNGSFVSYLINPQKGDGWPYLFSAEKNSTDSFPRAKSPSFSPNSDFLIFLITPQQDTVRQMKLKKVKKDKLPTDSLGILLTYTKTLIKIPQVKSFKVAEENSSWIVYHLEKDQSKPTKQDIADSLLSKAQKENIKKQQEKDKKQLKTHLVIYNPLTNKEFKFMNVEEYEISKNGKLIAFKPDPGTYYGPHPHLEIYDSESYRIFQEKTAQNPAVFQRELTPLNIRVGTARLDAPDDEPGGIPQLVGKVAPAFQPRRG